MRNNFLFLNLIFLSLTACQSSPVVPAPPVAEVVANTTGYSILQGVTGPTWTRINILRPKSEILEVLITREDTSEMNVLPFKLTARDYPGSEMVVDEYELKNLSVGTQYRLTVKDPLGKVVDQRNFQTLADKAFYNFAVVSCSDDSYKVEQKLMWEQLLSNSPEFILSIGDNVYADMKDGVRTPVTQGLALWNRYVDSRQTLQLYRSKQLVPTVAAWDDHDYGRNDGDRRFKLKSESLKVFLSFYPQEKPNENFVKGPGAASRWSLGGQAFLLLDNRSFRSPGKPSPACLAKPQAKECRPKPDLDGVDELAIKEPETHFGLEQERWAFAEVRKLRRPIWLVSGDQWFGAYQPFESYEGNHPNSFKKFVREMGKSAYRVAFISGDRHSSELTRVPKKYLGYESFEIVSSPIHAKTFPSNWTEFPNANQAFGTAEAMNYTLINSNIEKKAWKVRTKNLKRDLVEAFNAESLIWLNK